MEKEYVCTIDQAKFTSEEELVNHLKSLYSFAQAPGKDTSLIHKQLQDAFPEADVVIKNKNIDTEGIFVKLVFAKWKSDFEFVISNTYDETLYYNDTYFKTVNEAIDYYKGLIAQKDELIKAIYEKFDADGIKVHQIYDPPEYMDDSRPSMNFSFYVDGKEYRSSYSFDGINEHLRLLDGHFVSTVEGNVTMDYGKYNSQNTIYVDGIDIKVLAARAKKLKVKIIEFK